MTDAKVFISYKREDQDRVAKLAQALKIVGVPVWWDPDLLDAENYREQLHEKLKDAGCVVVVWSEGSVGKEGGFVRDEASRGLARDILVPVRIENVHPPLGFGEIQTVDLRHWRGDVRDSFFRDLVAVVHAKLTQTPPPPPKGPKARLARRLAYSAVSSTGMAVLSAFAINAFGVTSKMCTIPGPQPALADACGTLRIGGQPTRDERLAWAALPKGDCPALRAFVRDHPDSPLRSRAADLITAGERGGAWLNDTRQMSLYVAASDGEPKASEALARADALERAKGDADLACRSLGAGTVFRYVSATATAVKWSCEHAAGGVTCAFSGWANCAVQRQEERCG